MVGPAAASLLSSSWVHSAAGAGTGTGARAGTAAGAGTQQAVVLHVAGSAGMTSWTWNRSHMEPLHSHQLQKNSQANGPIPDPRSPIPPSRASLKPHVFKTALEKKLAFSEV